MRRTIGLVLGAVLLAGGCAGFAGIGAMSSFGEQEGLADGVRAVRLAGVDGDVTVRVGDTPRVSREVHYQDDRPGATHRVSGPVLELRACPSPDCWVDYDVVVPLGTKIAGSVSGGDVVAEGVSTAQLRADSGGVTVRGVQGAVTVDADSGNVGLTGIGGPVAVRSESGSVRLSGVRGTVAVDATSGDVRGDGLAGSRTSVRALSGSIDLRLRTAQDVLAEADSGNVHLTVPDGRYRVVSEVDSGSSDIGVRRDSNARHALTVRADSGNVTVLAG